MTDQNAKIQFTVAGLAEIQAELAELKNTKLPATIDRVSRARDFGDLSENAEYHAAKEELAFIEGRIEELESIVAKAEVVKVSSSGSVGLGCKGTVEQGGKDHTYEIVGEWEADPIKKKISHTSPLGQALLGKKKGENISFATPSGIAHYKILNVS